jgi:hypothetical protein
MSRGGGSFIAFFVAGSCLCSACQKPASTGHPGKSASVEPILLHASGACLATISRLEEHDDRPSDGDHRIEAWLKLEQSSGTVPEFIRLVIEPGGMVVEALPQAEGPKESMVLRPDSLRVGERHWFVFSEDYDTSRYPHSVAGWWRDSDGDVPLDVVAAVQNDRFADHPTWDRTLNVVTGWTQLDDEVRVHVRDADSLDPTTMLFETTLKGKLHLLRLNHGPIPYEMEWPQAEASHFVQVSTIGELPAGNEFDLPAGPCRIMCAFELRTGKKAAVWVARNQEVWLMQAFRQYDLDSGAPTIVMDFDLLTSGGIAAGADAENWYRRTVKRFHNGQLQSEEVFRHESIKTGTERIYSGSGWLPLKGMTSR